MIESDKLEDDYYWSLKLDSSLHYNQMDAHPYPKQNNIHLVHEKPRHVYIDRSNLKEGSSINSLYIYMCVHISINI